MSCKWRQEISLLGVIVTDFFDCHYNNETINYDSLSIIMSLFTYDFHIPWKNPQASVHLLASPCIFLHLLASPCISLHLLASPCISLRLLRVPGGSSAAHWPLIATLINTPERPPESPYGILWDSLGFSSITEGSPWFPHYYLAYWRLPCKWMRSDAGASTIQPLWIGSIIDCDVVVYPQVISTRARSWAPWITCTRRTSSTATWNRRTFSWTATATWKSPTLDSPRNSLTGPPLFLSLSLSLSPSLSLPLSPSFPIAG